MSMICPLPLTKTGVKFAAWLVCAWPVRLLAVHPLQLKLIAAVYGKPLCQNPTTETSNPQGRR